MPSVGTIVGRVPPSAKTLWQPMSHVLSALGGRATLIHNDESHSTWSTLWEESPSSFHRRINSWTKWSNRRTELGRDVPIHPHKWIHPPRNAAGSQNSSASRPSRQRSKSSCCGCDLSGRVDVDSALKVGTKVHAGERACVKQRGKLSNLGPGSGGWPFEENSHSTLEQSSLP